MFRTLTGMVVATVTVLVTLTGCQQRAGTQYEHPGQRYDTSKAQLVVTLPGLVAVRDDFLSLVVNLEGMEGLPALIEGAVGLDFSRLELLEEAGLDSQMAGLLFTYRDGVVLALGLADSGRFQGFLEQLSRAEAWTFRRTQTDGAVLYDMAGVALSLEGNLLTIFWGDGAREQLSALLLEPLPEGVVEPVRSGYAVSWRGRDLPLEQLLAPQFSQAGPLAGVARSLVRYLDRCSGVSGTVTMGDRLLGDVLARGCVAGLTLRPETEPETRVPEDTILLLHLRLPVDSLWASFPPVVKHLSRAWWAGLPGKRPAGLEDLGEVLQRFEGDVAVAFLGVSAQANLDTFSGSGDGLAPLFAIHWQLLLNLRPGETLDELFDPETMKTLLPQYEPQGLGAGDILASEYCRPRTQQSAQRCFSVVRQGQNLLIVTGVGQGDRLVRTLRGQSVPLARAMFAEPKRGPLTITLKTRRLVKDLMSMGFPPYFLQILSSILEVRMTVGDGEEGTTLSMEVVLR
jgi:hypothetical protein